MRLHRHRVWLKQYRWAKAQRSREAAEFCTYQNMGRWKYIKDLNDISNVWKTRKRGLSDVRRWYNRNQPWIIFVVIFVTCYAFLATITENARWP